MTPVIQQSVLFRTSPQVLFDLYLDLAPPFSFDRRPR